MTTLGDLGEDEVIRRLLEVAGPPGPAVLISAGEDDAAAWREPGGVVVGSIDTMVEGVHFDLAWLTPAQVGWRAVVLALGDLAAKGAAPTYALAALSAPAGLAAEVAVDFYLGMSEAAAEAGLFLVGGDTTATPGPIVISVTVLGRSPVPPLARSQAQPGWPLAVTGSLGAAAGALAAAQAHLSMNPVQEVALHRPRPRLLEGAELAACGLICGDISDGLLRELAKFGRVAGVGAVVEASAVPLAAGSDLDQALSSGEEVELVCTGPSASLVAAQARLPGLLTVIGRLTADRGVKVLEDDGTEHRITRSGHQHFA